MTIKLFLDDERPAPAGFFQYTSGEDLITYMINYPLGFAGTVDVLSIDHDLGDGMSGYVTIKKIVNDYPSIIDNIDEICIHSNNTVGRENIKQYLINAQENNVISSSLKIYPNYLQYNDGCLYDTVTGEKLY